MPLALEAVEEAFLLLARGEAIDLPRERVRLPQVTQHILQGAVPSRGLIGYKHYTSSREGTRFLVHLYDSGSGALLGVIEANLLGMMRTGAASGVATRCLAREDADTLALFGSGWQAQGQLRAIAAVRRLRLVRVVARHAERLQRFCTDMSAELGIAVEPAASAETAVRDAAIVTTVTTAASPLFKGEWLAPGTHVNAAGSNSLARQEIDEATLRRASAVFVDAVDTALREAGDLLPALEKGRLHRRQLVELGEVLAARRPGRRLPEDITLFESQGLAVQDLVLAGRLLDLAAARGLGEELSLGV
jgi:ornithine cyclodeaminase